MNNGKVWRNAGLYIVIVLIAVAFISTFFTPHHGEETRSYSEFLQLVEGHKLKSVQLRENLITADTTDGTRIKTMAPVTPPDPNLIDKLEKNGVDIKVLPPEQSAWWISLLSSVLLPILIFVGLWVFMLRQAQSGSSQAMSFGKSRAKLMMENKTKVTFADVAGVDEAKQELEEVVEFLKAPEKFQSLGAKIPRGVLLVGAPGTGKTLLARAIAGEAGVPFFSISGSDFVEMFVGVGASRVRDLFDQAKKQAPCIVFVDEIDAVGRQRGAGLGGGHDEREQTLNQLLVEMDGFEANNSVIVIAATNRPDILDSALLRPGRFDRQVVVDHPDVVGREQILKVHSRGKPLAPDVDLKLLAKRTPGFTGADLANLMNEAALLAARKDKKQIEMWDVDQSIDKVIAGPEKKNRIISEKEKRIIAIHELGHAIVAKMCAHADPVHKVTVVSRGMALGVTISLPEDRVLTSRTQLNDRLAMTMGGRVAEEIIFGEITTGASNDIDKATKLARKMVTEFGMSDVLGPASFGKAQEHIFLGRDMGADRNFGEEVAGTIDREIRRIIDEAYERATKILTDNKEKLLGIADVLIERETIDGEELDRLLKGESPEVVFPVPKEKAKTGTLEKPAEKPETPPERGGEQPPPLSPAPA